MHAADLQWLRLVSPALPVGAYAYSRGLESAVEVGAVHDEASAQAWIVGVLEHGAGMLDAPVCARLHAAFAADDLAAARRWNAWLLAARESGELQREDEQMGASLLRLLRDLGVEGASAWTAEARVSFVTMFGFGAVRWGIGAERTLGGYLWTIAEAQVGAALRLLSVGQTAGQRILSAAIERIPACVDVALGLPDEAIGNLTAGLAVGSACHETQYSRLFRS
jgi:urease accessory protein